MATDSETVTRIQRDDGTPAADLIERYAAGAAMLETATGSMTDVQLRARPVPGKLSSAEVVAHVADCEQMLAERLKRTIAMDRPLLMAIAEERYAEALRYAERDLAADLALVRATRAQLAGDLRRLEPTGWEREAVHSQTGVVTVRQQVLHAIRHLEWHVGTIEEKRAALGLPTAL